MAGTLRVDDESGHHICVGKWAKSFDRLRIDGGDHIRFELTAFNTCGKDLPVDSEAYRGSFKMKHERNRFETVNEDQIVLKFVKNTTDSFNVYGKGMNRMGVYDILGIFILEEYLRPDSLVSFAPESQADLDEESPCKKNGWSLFDAMKQCGWKLMDSGVLKKKKLSSVAVHPAFASWNVNRIAKECRHGEHYFIHRDEEFMRYVRKAYGWKEPCSLIKEGAKSNHGGKQGDKASRGTNTNVPCSDFSSALNEKSSVDKMYQVMKNMEAWKLLKNLFGFSYTGGKYCLPGKENKPSVSSAHEGINFFSSIEELRKHLCAYGLPVSKKALSDKEKVDISRWVGYAHISSIADGALINEEYIGKLINQSKAFVLLQQLGLKYTSGYVIPKSSSHAYKKFERAEEFYKYLARLGIPHYDNAPGPSLSTAEGLKLDLFVYNPGKHVDTFERIDPQSNEVTPELESWIRCAHMKGLGEPARIPTYLGMSSKKARAVIEALGYKISNDLSMCINPGADFRNSTMSKDGWEHLIGFINHIARFGLAYDSGVEDKSRVSSRDLIDFQIYIVTTSTHDVSKRSKGNVPIEMKRNAKKVHLCEEEHDQPDNTEEVTSHDKDHRKLGSKCQKTTVHESKAAQSRMSPAPTINDQEEAILKQVRGYEEFLRLGIIADNEKDDAIRKLKDVEVERDAAMKREALKASILEKDEALRKLEALVFEKNKALESVEKERNSKDVEMKAARKERDSAMKEKRLAIKQRDEALKRVECFVRLSHKNDLFAFTPCGHAVCSDCKDNYTLDDECPKCKCKITGRIRVNI